MKKPSDPSENWDSLRNKIIGLGERSLRKSYYPELQRQLEATRESETRFRLLAELTHDGVLIIESGAVQYANPRLSDILGEAVTGLSGDSMVGSLFAQLDMDALAQADSPGEQLWLVRPDGRKRYLHVRCFRLHLDELGDPLYVVVTDMTAQKLRETALERRVQERTAELQQANEKLKELDQLKNDFISNVSHDLRTPLTNIQLFSQLLELNKNPEKQAHYWSVLNAEAAHLEMLINDLLTLSSLEHGRFPQRRERTDIHQLIRQELQSFQARIKDKQLTVQYAPQDHLPLVLLDAHKIRQVIVNLLANAIAYTLPQGHICISCTAVPDDESPIVCIEVQNDGPPIPAEDLPNLFQRFYRGENARVAQEHGTGLGLAICKQIVEQHAGTITVTSTEVEGTSVLVCLPLF